MSRRPIGAVRSATVTSDTDDRLRLSPEFLWNLGFRSLTRVQATDLLSEIYDTLETRVGVRIAENLDENQLNRFEKIVAGHDEQEALRWLNTNVPAYKEIVKLEFQHVANTLRAAADLRKSASPERLEGPHERFESQLDE